MKYNSTILTSIFIRKGGEGSFTKIISENNNLEYKNLFSDYIKDEIPIIIQYTNANYWFMLSNYRIILAENNAISDICLDTITKISAPVFKEAMIGTKSVNEFSLIELETKEQQKYLLKTEGGRPYTGLFHILQFIQNKNYNLN